MLLNWWDVAILLFMVYLSVTIVVSAACEYVWDSLTWPLWVGTFLWHGFLGKTRLGNWVLRLLCAVPKASRNSSKKD